MDALYFGHNQLLAQWRVGRSMSWSTSRELLRCGWLGGELGAQGFHGIEMVSSSTTNTKVLMSKLTQMQRLEKTDIVSVSI